MIDFGRAIQHPFEDKDWAVKMLVGAGVSLVPILNFAMSGYALQVQRNTATGQDVPLPRWDDLGKHLTDGLKLFVVQLIYAIPLLIVSFGFLVLGGVFGASSGRMSGSARDAVGAGFTILTLGLTCVTILYGLVYAFIIPATYIQLARTGEIGSAFHFSELLAVIKRNTGDYVIVFIAPVIIGFGFTLVFGVINIIPFVGLCVTFLVIPLMLLVAPYISIVFGHLYGQLMRP